MWKSLHPIHGQAFLSDEPGATAFGSICESGTATPSSWPTCVVTASYLNPLVSMSMQEIRDIAEGKCCHYYFGCFLIQFLSGVAVTICSCRHYMFWSSLCVHASELFSGHHYLFGLSLFVLAVTICKQKLNGESAKIIMTTFAFRYVSYFLYEFYQCCFKFQEVFFNVNNSIPLFVCFFLVHC